MKSLKTIALVFASAVITLGANAQVPTTVSAVKQDANAAAPVVKQEAKTVGATVKQDAKTAGTAVKQEAKLAGTAVKQEVKKEAPVVKKEAVAVAKTEAQKVADSKKAAPIKADVKKVENARPASK